MSIMQKKIIYYIGHDEDKYIVDEVQKNPGSLRNAEFRQIDWGVLRNSKIIDLDRLSVDAYFGNVDDPFEDNVALVWGSGFFHHYSVFLSPTKEFMKSVDDAHADLGWQGTPSLTGNPSQIIGIALENYLAHNCRLFCMNKWIRYLEVRDNLKPDLIEADFVGENFEKKYLELHNSPSRFINSKINHPVHKSIDLDVVPGFPAMYKWQNDSGQLFSLEELKADLEKLCTSMSVIRFDVGGLHFPREGEEKRHDSNINPLKDEKALQFAVNCYKVLLETYFNNCHKHR